MPERRELPKINIRPKELPFDQIVAVKGRNPLGESLPMFGKVISDAMVNRANIRRMGEQTAAIEKAMGAEPGTYAGLSPDQAEKIAALKQQAELKKMMQQYTIPSYDAEGQVSGFTPVPLGMKPFGGMKQNAEANTRASGNLDLRQKGAELQLNSAFRKESEPYKNALLGYKEAMAAVNQKTGVGDSSLVRAIVKVAEGKGARVSDADVLAFARTGSIPENLKGEFLKAATGARLSDEVRSQFKNLLESYYDAHKTRQQQIENEFSITAKNYGFNPDRVVMKFRPIEEYSNPNTMPVSSQGHSPVQVNSGIALSGQSAQRLAELRAKKASGTLR